MSSHRSGAASSGDERDEAAAAAAAHWPSPRHLLILAATGLGTSAVLGLALRSHVTPLDSWLHDLVVDHRGDHHNLARTLTQAGSTKIVWPMVGLAALLFPRTEGWRRWATSAAFLGAAAAAIGVRLETSLAITRPRPPTVDWVGTAGGWAYPSGHTSAATIGAGALGWALVRHLDNGSARVAVWVAVAAYAGMVGWTRIWLGVHWPTDVVGAWLFGLGWLSGMAAVAVAVERLPER